MNPLLRLSHYRALKINGQWYTYRQLVLDSEDTSGLVGAGISGGKVTIRSVYLPSTEAQAKAVMNGQPALVVDGPVFIDRALVNSGGTLSNARGELTTVRQEAVVKVRECEQEVWWDENYEETQHTTDWHDTGEEVSFWFDALGIKTSSQAAPAIQISGVREQNIATSIQACRTHELLGSNQEEILDGGWTAGRLTWPAFDLTPTVNTQYGDGPFEHPLHHALAARQFPIAREGGGGGGAYWYHWHYTYRFSYYYSANFNLFGPFTRITDHIYPSRFDDPESD